jgi:hypothetical protein
VTGGMGTDGILTGGSGTDGMLIGGRGTPVEGGEPDSHEWHSGSAFSHARASGDEESASMASASSADNLVESIAGCCYASELMRLVRTVCGGRRRRGSPFLYRRALAAWGRGIIARAGHWCGGIGMQRGKSSRGEPVGLLVLDSGHLGPWLAAMAPKQACDTRLVASESMIEASSLPFVALLCASVHSAGGARFFCTFGAHRLLTMYAWLHVSFFPQEQVGSPKSLLKAWFRTRRKGR